MSKNETPPLPTQEVLASFNKRFFALMEEAEKAGVPIPYREAWCRDYLSAIEALRLSAPLLDHFKRLGVSSLMFRGSRP